MDLCAAGGGGAAAGFDPEGATPEDRARPSSLYFGDLLHSQVRAFNPKCQTAEGALIREFQRRHADIAGNREFLTYLRNRGKFFSAEESRELDLMLIDYEEPSRNVFEVTEEFYCHNGHYGTREDVVFLINGISVLMIECKNAGKDEVNAIVKDLNLLKQLFQSEREGTGKEYVEIIERNFDGYGDR